MEPSKSEEELFQRLLQMFPAHRKVNVLIVGDAVLGKRIHCFMCGRFDFLVQVLNGEEAFNLYEKRRLFELVLIDMQTPVMDGPAVTRRIREMGIECMIIGVGSNDVENGAFMACWSRSFSQNPLSTYDLKLYIDRAIREIDVYHFIAASEELHPSVLIVGNDPVTVRMRRRIGCTTQMATNGREVADLYKSERVSFDLIIVNKELYKDDDSTRVIKDHD